jgi:hypothetical protein
VSLPPRAVLVHRRSEYDEAVARHGTRAMAAFFLQQRGREIDELAERHVRVERALQQVAAAVPAEWRRAEIERADLDRFVFGPEDVVVVVGQDGLVANVAKYLVGQPVVGIDPEPGRNPGVLVPHAPQDAADLLVLAAAPDPPIEERTMVRAAADDGQTLLALNEVYVGHATHQSARYELAVPEGRAEHQSSSGLLAGTGTGATGWLRSVWGERGSRLDLPRPDEARLCWFVREAWPSPATGTELTEGTLVAAQALTVTVETDALVCFGDGIEHDALSLTWGQRLTVATADRRLRLVRG